MTRGRITAVIGAQYGSEGKGAVVAHIANQYGAHVRVGSPNAGHTIYWRGEKHVMQSIPCGWTNPDASIIIGRGALINVEQLISELEHIERYYPQFKRRLHIDPEAGVLGKKFRDLEGGTGGEMHKRIGSTGEGVGLARMARISRDPDQFQLFGSLAAEIGLEGCVTENTPDLIARLQDTGTNMLIEGTQGSALSLIHSYWPYCTSIDTNAAAILSECGVAPARLTDTLLVARTYPIRVWGNSGPMQAEISWKELSRRLNKNVDERTTVTKKTRRVGEWDNDLFENAVMLNDPTAVALTFADYIDPSLYGCEDAEVVMKSKELNAFIDGHGLRRLLKYVGTGPKTMVEVR